MSTPRRVDAIQGEILHEYDGIEEADNRLPIWWLATFFGAVAFGVFYWSYYEAWHIGDSTTELYAAEAAERLTAGGEVTDEVLVTLSQNDSLVSTGRATFVANCVVCHGDSGQGNIGPNLTDGSWIHGGAPTDIYATVQNGVAARGMPPWGPVLGNAGVQGAVAYILTIRDTNLEGRAAEGEVYVPAGEATPTEGEVAPAEGEGAPAEGEGAPAEEEVAPAQGAEAPAPAPAP